MKLLSDAWLLALKDLQVYVRDRSALCLGFLVPIALVTAFGWIMTYAFGGSSDMPKVALWVVDEDQSARSQKIVESLRASEMLKLRPRVDEKPIDSAKLRKLIADGEAHHGIVVPKGYGQTTGSDNQPNLKMIRDPGRTMEDRMIQIALVQSTFTDRDRGAWKTSLRKMFKERGMDIDHIQRLDSDMEMMQSTIRSFFGGEEEEGTETSGPASSSTKSAGQELKSDEPTSNASASTMDFMSNMVALDTEEIRPPSRSKLVTYQQAQSVAGMSVMMLLFGLTGAGSLLIAEREIGTLKRLFGLPIARESVLLGKLMFVFVLGVVQMLVLFIYGELMFRVGLFRDPVTLAAIIVTWVSASSCFGMLVATFSKSAKQADSLATILILTMAALGGCWFPLQMMTLPWTMDILTKSMMTYWAMEGLQGMLWNNLSLFDPKIQIALAIQWCWIIGLGSLSLYFFRKNYIAG